MAQIVSPVLYKTRDRSARSTNPAPDGAYFDPAKAAAAVAWVEKHCRHSTGEFAGKPYILDPNARQFFEDFYGWRRYEDGLRLYRECFDAEGRKNGKTTRAAAVGLALTIADNEPRGQVYAVAGNEAQASIVHNEAKAMIGQSPELYKCTEILAKAIYCPSQASIFKPLPSKASTQHGLNPHGVIGDEVHEWTGRDQYDVMHTAVGARRQPFEYYITTAGDDLTSLCWTMWDYARKVRDGIHNDRAFLPIIFEADPKDDPGDPATWAKANPNLGVSIKLDYLREKYERALLIPTEMAAFKRLHLNLWVSSSAKWMPVEIWNKDENKAPFDEDSLVGRECYFGLDLAWKQDITALIILFPPAAGDPAWRVICRFFVPDHEIVQRAKRDNVPYDVWAQQKLLTLTDGNVTDFDAVENAIFELGKKFSPKALGFDRLFAGQVINNLTARGMNCVEVGQGFMSTAMPMAEVERAAESGRFRHGGHPILGWMATNVVADIDKSGNKRPNKLKSHQRIDGIPATLNAMALALAGNGAAPNPYADKGILILR